MRPAFLALTALLAVITPVHADVVVTVDGARLTGRITLIDEGVIHLDTPYAGVLKIKQGQVASFETDAPRVVRLKSGTTMAGPIQSSTDGKLKIISEDGVLETNTSGVVTSWAVGAEDPVVVKNRRSWRFNAGIDLFGKHGNAEEFALGANFKAKLKSPDDELAFFAEYQQREQDGNKTADRAAGGMSYESFFSEVLGWYVRTELETDAIDQIDLRSTSGIGMSYRLINKEHQTLVARTGLGYRFTTYRDDTENESSPTLDFGLNHTYRFKENFAMQNELTYVPSIDDFGRYRVVHDSGLEIPVGSGDNWKIRMGIKHEYESQPAAEEKLDTTYYTRMIYSWD